MRKARCSSSGQCPRSPHDAQSLGAEGPHGISAAQRAALIVVEGLNLLHRKGGRLFLQHRHRFRVIVVIMSVRTVDRIRAGLKRRIAVHAVGIHNDPVTAALQTKTRMPQPGYFHKRHPFPVFMDSILCYSPVHQLESTYYLSYCIFLLQSRASSSCNIILRISSFYLLFRCSAPCYDEQTLNNKERYPHVCSVFSDARRRLQRASAHH